jgi:hypothetical protein
LPRLPARALQPLVWDAVAAALLDPGTLETGLQAGQTQYRTAQAHWMTTRKTLDRQLARHRNVLKELVMSQATAKRGSPTWQALAQAIQQADTTITQLERERDAGAPRVLPGISPDRATASRPSRAQCAGASRTLRRTSDGKSCNCWVGRQRCTMTHTA